MRNRWIDRLGFIQSILCHTPSHTRVPIKREIREVSGGVRFGKGVGLSITGSKAVPPEALMVRSEISSTMGRKSARGARDCRLRRLSQGESCTSPEKKESRDEKATPKVNPSPRCTVASAHGSYTPLPSPLASAEDAAAARRTTAATTDAAHLDVFAAITWNFLGARLASGATKSLTRGLWLARFLLQFTKD